MNSQTFNTFNKKLSNQIDWQSTMRSLIKNKITNKKTSSKQAAKNTFRLKTLLDMLPILEEMNDRYPNLYKNQPCLKCNNAIETSLYVFTCQNLLEEVQNSIKKILIDVINKYTIQKYTETIINRKLAKSNLLRIDPQ